MKKILIILFSLFFLFNIAYAMPIQQYHFKITKRPKHYYFSQSGNDTTGDGSMATPWKTIAKFNDELGLGTFISGDIINFNRGDTWSSDETLGCESADGTSCVNWPAITLTIQAYGTGARPHFDGDTQQPIFIYDADPTLIFKDIDISGTASCTGAGSWTQLSAMYLRLVQGVTIDNLYADGDVTTRHQVDAAVKIFNIDGTFQITNSTILEYGGNTSNPESGIDAHGIHIFAEPVELCYGVDQPNDCCSGVGTEDSPGACPDMTDFLIQNVTIHSVSGDGIQVGGFVGTGSNWGIIDGQATANIHDCGENSIDIKSSRQVRITNLTLYRDGWADGGTSGAGSLVQVNCGSNWNSAYTQDFESINNKFGPNVDDSSGTWAGIGQGCASVGILSQDDYFLNVMPAWLLAEGDSQGKILWNALIVVDSAIDSGTSDSMARLKFTGGTNFVGYNTIDVRNVTLDYLLGFFVHDSSSNVTFQNNIVRFDRNDADYLPFYGWNNSTDPSLDHNDWHNASHTNRVCWEATAVSDPEACTGGTLYVSTEEETWQGLHTGGLFSDPPFSDGANKDFSLTSSLEGTDAGASYDDGWDDATSLPPTTVTTISRDSEEHSMGVYVYEAP